MNTSSHFPHRIQKGFHYGIATLGLLALSSCGEKEEEKKADVPDRMTATSSASSTTTADQATATPTSTSSASKEKEALDKMLYNDVISLVTRHAAQPIMQDTARLLLEKLELYQAALPATAPALDQFLLTMKIADLRRELTAWRRANESYEAALALWDKLSADEQNELSNKRLKSSLYNGLAVTLFSLPLEEGEAMPDRHDKLQKTFKQQLNTEKATYDALVASGAEQAEILQSAADVISAYRCVGDGFYYTGNLEDGREWYEAALVFASELKNLNDIVLLQFVRTLSIVGELESKAGNNKKALERLAKAAEVIPQLFNLSQKSSIKQETRAINTKIAPIIKELQAQIIAEGRAVEEIAQPEELPAEGA